MSNKLYIIGLTGNIACGKSTVLNYLRQQGAHVIDADRVTHELQQPGTAVYAAIVERFGTDILTAPAGPIDRRKLGAIVFADPHALRTLEQIVHPAVHQRITDWLNEVAAQFGVASETNVARPVAVIDAIKLLESGWRQISNAIWVVTCTPEQQLERLMTTRHMSEDDARTRIAAQPPQAAKIAQADVVIDNSGTLDATRHQVEQSWQAIQHS